MFRNILPVDIKYFISNALKSQTKDVVLLSSSEETRMFRKSRDISFYSNASRSNFLHSATSIHPFAPSNEKLFELGSDFLYPERHMCKMALTFCSPKDYSHAEMNSRCLLMIKFLNPTCSQALSMCSEAFTGRKMK
jgi:hypothetical protein